MAQELKVCEAYICHNEFSQNELPQKKDAIVKSASYKEEDDWWDYAAKIECYRKEDVGKVIAELRGDIKDLWDDKHDTDKLLDERNAEIAELKDKCQMHDFFWEGCGFAKRGFKNTIAVSEAFDKLEAENTKLKTENKRLQEFCDELTKDCKWLPTTITPDKHGFETMVQCTNGKKRVASFRSFDRRWYDVNNGYKLNVVKWLWQPSMPSNDKAAEKFKEAK